MGEQRLSGYEPEWPCRTRTFARWRQHSQL